jgi:hypothetical protein
MERPLTVINAFWIGDTLGAVHAACLRSFARHGYRVMLHCYDPPSDLPDGVEVFPAQTLMRRDEIARYQESGTLALASDIYRFRILREGMGTYVDADIYCLRQLPLDDYLIGFEADKRANGAVLKIPAGSELMTEILKASEDPYFIPPFKRKHAHQNFARFRKLVGFPIHVSDQPFGILGPHLLTYMIEHHKLHDLVQPIDIFYPLHFKNVSLLFERGLTLADITTSRSSTIHLFNGALRGREILPDTPLHEVISS